MQTTSEDKAIPFLEAHKGVVLAAGKSTIGAGLNAASGVLVMRRTAAWTVHQDERVVLGTYITPRTGPLTIEEVSMAVMVPASTSETCSREA